MAQPTLSARNTQPETLRNSLVIQNVRGTSRLTENRFTQPFRTLNPANSGEYVQVYLSNYGGGFVQGDSISCDVHVGPEAHAYLGTQANTRVYSPDSERPCAQHLDGSVGDKGSLIIWPDPLVLHADSSFTQTQTWRLSSSSRLILLDIIGPGRMNDGELFSYEELQTDVRITVDDRPFITDTYRFRPEEDTPSDPGHYAHYRFLLSLYMVGTDMAAHEDGLCTALRDGDFLTEAHERRDQALVSVSPHQDNALILKALLNESRQVDRIRSILSTFFSENGLSGAMQWGRRY